MIYRPGGPNFVSSHRLPNLSGIVADGACAIVHPSIKVGNPEENLGRWFGNNPAYLQTNNFAGQVKLRHFLILWLNLQFFYTLYQRSHAELETNLKHQLDIIL